MGLSFLETKQDLMSKPREWSRQYKSIQKESDYKTKYGENILFTV